MQADATPGVIPFVPEPQDELLAWLQAPGGIPFVPEPQDELPSLVQAPDATQDAPPELDDSPGGPQERVGLPSWTRDEIQSLLLDALLDGYCLLLGVIRFWSQVVRLCGFRGASPGVLRSHLPDEPRSALPGEPRSVLLVEFRSVLPDEPRSVLLVELRSALLVELRSLLLVELRSSPPEWFRSVLLLRDGHCKDDRCGPEPLG
ncbi:MAG TPA: hypothetical protein VFW25_09850 [Silvibacterium sp.]|nr:hypothetical protein [Silvibacterium sp.]